MPIAYIVDGHVAQVTLDAPDALNALTPEEMVELRGRLEAARDDPDVRVIVLTGAGERAFCTGANLKKTLPPETSFAEAFWLSAERAAEHGIYIRALDFARLDLWKPMVAAINGYCIGGGFEIALQCDLRIASPSATFALVEPRIGSIPAVGGIQRLVRAIPSAVAMKLLLSGGRLEAADAERYGLVSEVVEAEALMERAHQLAAEVAANAPLAVQAIKRLVWQGLNMPLREALVLEEATWGLLRDTEDRVEGRIAFAEKRPPRFTGH
jgi:E-phenylitaconyl-CoA hydratase